ncbi:MAG: nuclear transport factor 2 family protein [Gammaproteobacteria bacterium]
MTPEETVIAYEERLRAAQLAGDLTELDALLDADLIFAALDGTVVRKADDLELHRSGTLRILQMDVISREIICFGTTAVVNVAMMASARIVDAVRDDRIRYIRVWHEFPDGWRIVSGSMSLMHGD